MTEGYYKAYQDYAGTKKLYYYDSEYVFKKSNVINRWREHVSNDSLEYEFPLFVPKKFLDNSGHLKEFGSQIFELEKSELCLRPETASSIFPHIKQIMIEKKEKNKELKISQVGKAFRNQKTTRDRFFRVKEFDQLEIEILSKKQDSESFFKQYQLKLDLFFKTLGISYYTKEVSETERPHYSKKTVDYYCLTPDTNQPLELGCLSDRGNHDIKEVKDLRGYKIYECSLGLTRILLVLLQKNFT